ncbi:TonB-dependent receptor [Novosphingobium sp. Gsoil 351]|uniref:TonB-dependent receptor n=1 Tax=Novosphingobium sp. Gsoil 351 TaxID=2675225 RepID=UPI0018A879F3|nr:TonB-dependent receptor [Novosphingobium sp. Gsoil 351]
MTRSVHALLLTVSLAAVALPTSANAQAAPAGEQASSDTNDSGIGDIVVTAQKREERLQTVPIAITAIDSRGLEQAGIKDITRLEVVTPGLSVGQSGSDTRPALRGVNTDNSRQAQADATVAFFVDGIYQSSNQQALAGFLDLARVEVQRGPQGTLYGRNSFGGNISLVSNLPGRDFEVIGKGEYSRFNHYKLTGIVSSPLGDTAGLRVAAQYEKSDGYVRNLTPGGTRAGDIDDFTGRATLRLEPSDRLELIARGNVWIGKGAGAGAYEYKVEGIQVNAAGDQDIAGTTILYVNPRARQSDIATLPAAGVPVNRYPWTIEQDTPSTRDIRDYAGSLELNYDFDFARLKLLGSYNDFDANRTSDGDFTAFLVRTNIQHSTNRTWTGEAQLASASTRPFQWILGGYYLDTKASEFFQQRRVTLGIITDETLSRYSTKSYAFFGQASYNLTEQLRLTGGARYTNDEKIASGVDTANLTAGQPTVYPRRSRHFDKVTWRGALDYQVTPDKLIYASVSNGFPLGRVQPAGGRSAAERRRRHYILPSGNGHRLRGRRQDPVA